MPKHSNTDELRPLFKEWLEKLQQESWQLELLISGLALFGVWSSRNSLAQLDYYLQINGSGAFNSWINLLVNVLWFGWAIFMVNLILHIVIRGLWIGAIGLRYVSGDIDFENLNYSERFTNYYKRKFISFDHYIEKLEKLSSVLFSYTFLLFFILFSFAFSISVIALLMNASDTLFDGKFKIIVQTFGLIYITFGFIVLIDFVTLGSFKKIKEKSISGIYFQIYRFFSTISLSFIYRPLLLNFIDHHYTRKLFFLAVPYSLFIVFASSALKFENFSFFPFFKQGSFSGNESFIHWNSYDDEREKYYQLFGDDQFVRRKKIHHASLSNYQVVDNHLTIFLEYNKSLDEKLENESSDLMPYRKTGLITLFRRASQPDSIAREIRYDRLRELKLMNDAILGNPIDDELSNRFPGKLEYYKQFDKDNIDSLAAKIEVNGRNLYRNYYNQKSKNTASKMLGLSQVYIDDKLVNDSLNCNFYIHPNMHERGLLCHFRLDHVSKGQHTVTIDKKQYNKRNKDYEMETIILPFYIK